jgi:hypothetical protein
MPWEWPIRPPSDPIFAHSPDMTFFHQTFPGGYWQMLQDADEEVKKMDTGGGTR